MIVKNTFIPGAPYMALVVYFLYRCQELTCLPSENTCIIGVVIIDCQVLKETPPVDHVALR